MELYVHLPFCVKKCRYCDFVSFPGIESRMEVYVDALLQEAALNRKNCEEAIDTVYWGGGTPSLLPPHLLKKLACGLRSILPMSAVSEWTVEANPGTITPVWLDMALENEVNRLSLGMQAAQDHLLQALGRIHRMEDTLESIQLARKAGFQNLNLDLMFGLPGQSLTDWQHTIQTALRLQPTHISGYGLIPEEGTPLFLDLEAGKLALPEVELEREMYDLLLRAMTSAGFLQYEISNFALPGSACQHNIGYWTQIPYLGLGLSSASLLSLRRNEDGLYYTRRTNTADLESYLRSLREGKLPAASVQKILPGEARFETMMLGLRMNQGIHETDFRRMHHRTLESCFGPRLRMLEGRGLVTLLNGCWRLTREGMDLQNQVLVELMD